MSSYSSIENEYKQQEDEDYEDYRDWKERRDREKGILPEGYPIGDTLHPDTVKSYANLGLDTPDSVYYASRRATERMLKMHRALAIEKGEKFEVKKTITRVYRLKDKDNGKEYMAWNESLSFEDRMDNIHTLDYSRCGTHERAIGNIRKNINGKILGGEVTGIKVIFDKDWSTKEFDLLMKQHQGEPKQTDYVIGFTKNHGKNSLYSEGDKTYSIKCAEDFKTAKFEELWELSRRGLSSTQPSLSKLQNPISDDPAISEVKRERFMINPNAISYAQKTYQ
jgi:hypothetical protein